MTYTYRSIFVAISLLVLPATSAAEAPAPWIDAHVHTSPRFYGPLIDLLGSYGVTRFVNLSGGHGERLRSSLEAAARYEPQIAVCTSPNWQKLHTPNFGQKQAALLRKAHAMGAKCLKISKALGLYLTVHDEASQEQLLKIDTPRLDPLWKTAGQLGMPVFIHTADPKAFFEPLTADNERYDELSVHPEWSFYGPNFPTRQSLLDARNRVFARHRSTQFVAVHFANNPEDIESVDRLLDMHENVVVDIAARVPELGRHNPTVVRRIFTKHQHRILFGTDLGFSSQNIMLGSVGRDKPKPHDIFEFYARHQSWLESNTRQIPHPTPIQGRWKIDGIGLSKDVLDNVYWRNAIRIIWKTNADSRRERRFLNGTPDMSEYYPN